MYLVDHFLPESRYNVTRLDDWESDPLSYIGAIVHAFPMDYTKHETLNIKGGNFFGYIPKDELSIYPVEYFKGNRIPKFLPGLIRGNRVTAKIIGFENGLFILSRKKSMQEALATFKLGQIVMCTNISSTHNSVFVDIGAGINAIIPSPEISDCSIEDVSELFKSRHYFPVQLTEYSIYKDKYVASYKRVSMQLKLSKHDKVKGIPTSLTPDGTGVFVEITPTQVGMLDVDYLTVSYEDDGSDIVMFKEYEFIVTRIRLSRDETKMTMKNIYSLKLAN